MALIFNEVILLVTRQLRKYKVMHCDQFHGTFVQTTEVMVGGGDN